MPWFPELYAGQALADTLQRHLAQRLPFYDGLRQRDPEALEDSFAGRPAIDDPRHGHVEGPEAFAAYVESIRSWLRDDTTGTVEPVRVTQGPLRAVEEVSIKLSGDHPELPVAIVSDLAADGCIGAIRVYHSLWPLTGTHAVRAPLLEPDPSLKLTGAPADYQRALAAGDADAVVAAFEPDGEVREPAGGPYRYTGDGHRRIYELQFANGGGIPLRFCTVTDDGVACAIEYVCDRWGRDAVPPQAGVAVYERGESGRLRAARIYDDVTPPEASDSSL
jgi:hypothetical protein